MIIENEKSKCLVIKRKDLSLKSCLLNCLVKEQTDSVKSAVKL